MFIAVIWHSLIWIFCFMHGRNYQLPLQPTTITLSSANLCWLHLFSARSSWFQLVLCGSSLFKLVLARSSSFLVLVCTIALPIRRVMEYLNVIMCEMFFTFFHLERKCLHSRNHVWKKPTRNIPNTPDFWLKNKMSHNNLCVFIIISTLLYLLNLLSSHKLLVYPPFQFILYDECSEDVRREHTSAKFTMRNEETPKRPSRIKWCIFKKLSDITLNEVAYVKRAYSITLNNWNDLMSYLVIAYF